ncbi:MAG: helix-turn-helix domain-containing protein [Dehalococcoidia bacterium]
MKWPFLQRGDPGPEPPTAEEQRERARRTGEVLRQARTGLGLTVGDVERDIRINRVYLEALEHGRFEVLPAPVYARGFMRAYARYLALDPEEAALAVPTDLPRPDGLEPLPGLRRTPPPALPEINASLVGVAAAVVLLVAVVAFAAPRLFGGDDVESPVIATATEGVGDPAAETNATPDLVGMQQQEAEAALAQAGLMPLVFESLNEAPAGEVFRQSPEAGEPTQRDDVITLFISLGPDAQGVPTED